MIIHHKGDVWASDIGAGVSGLYCNTNRSDCCRGSDAVDGVAQGHWYRPDGTQVGSFSQELASDPTRNFFYRDRISGAVRLHRFGNPSERGHFYCEVPDVDGANETIAVYIGEWFVSSSTASSTILLTFWDHSRGTTDHLGILYSREHTTSNRDSTNNCFTASCNYQCCCHIFQ